MNMNKNILKTTYIFVGLFLILIIYLQGYIFLKSKDDINNPYNKRHDILAEKVVRGTIYSRDKISLAETVTDEDGNENRVYPYDELFCHVVGSFDMGPYCLESFYNFELLSSKNTLIEEVKTEFNGEKLYGNSIITTLDIDLQSVCDKALGDYTGSVILIDATNGDILSMVSKPGYNPNEIKELWNAIKSEENAVLLNRATQGLYPPGSIFKIFTLGEYIESHKKSYMDYVYECSGTIKFLDFSMSCSFKRPHNTVNLKEALANSCNCAFANIGTMIDAGKLNEYCENRLFNCELPIDIPYTFSKITVSNEDSEFIKSQTAIGQGETLVTPIHMCLVMSSIVNNGQLMKPRLVTSIIDKNDLVVKEIESEVYSTLYTADESNILKDYLREVVNSGTAYRLRRDDMDIYGKTGTAQISTTGKAHSWFVGGIETNNNKYAIAVIIENIDENTAPSIIVSKEIINSLDK